MFLEKDRRGRYFIAVFFAKTNIKLEILKRIICKTLYKLASIPLKTFRLLTNPILFSPLNEILLRQFRVLALDKEPRWFREVIPHSIVIMEERHSGHNNLWIRAKVKQHLIHETNKSIIWKDDKFYYLVFFLFCNEQKHEIKQERLDWPTFFWSLAENGTSFHCIDLHTSRKHCQ